MLIYRAKHLVAVYAISTTHPSVMETLQEAMQRPSPSSATGSAQSIYVSSDYLRFILLIHDPADGQVSMDR